jgi:site-specific DNA-methyltransferase (adenine-specific)
VAALNEGFRFIGFDKDEDEHGKPLGYVEIATARLRHAAGDPAPSATPETSSEAMLSL